MAASLTLRRSVPPYEARDVQSYDMDLEVLSAVDCPKEIFLFQVGVAPARTAGDEPGAFFVAVADPCDLDDVGVTPPNPVDTCPFYRSDKVSLRFRSVTDLEETFQYISSDITGLIAALNAGVQGGSTTDTVFS